MKSRVRKPEKRWTLAHPGGVTGLYGDKRCMFHEGSNVAKKIDGWVQKELRDSQHRGEAKKTTCATST